MTDRQERASALLRQGLSLRKVAEEVGVSVTAIKKWKRDGVIDVAEPVTVVAVADDRPHRLRLLDNLCRAADDLTQNLERCDDVHLKSEGVRALADAVKSVGDGQGEMTERRGLSFSAMMAKIQGRIEEING